jgi:transcriptional regulator with XRE-family HTH domain
MSYAEFLMELARAGLSVRAFAELLGMNPNSVSNYARAEELPTHLALIAVLVAELSVQGLDYRAAIAKVECTPKKPRGRGQPGHFGGNPQVPMDFGA